MAKIVDPSAGYMPIPITFKRGNAIPIDTSMVWTNESDMRAYAANKAGTSYVGQILVLASGGNVTTFVIKDVDGTIEKMPFESEISGSIGPISGDVELLKTSVSSVSGSIETLAESMVEMDSSLRSAITSATTSAHDNAVIDAGTNMQSYLTNTYTPFVEGLDADVLTAANAAAASGDAGIKTLISGETARATTEESKKIDKDSIATALTQSSTDDTVPGAKTTYEFVNSSIANMAAFYLYKNAAGDSFATKAELTAAIASGNFYNGGVKVTPKKNDYTIVQEDESHSSGSNPTTRYVFDGTNWVFQYVVNNTTFNEAQLAAINSTITETKLGEITGSIDSHDTQIAGISTSVSELSGTVQELAGTSSSTTTDLSNLSGSVTTTSSTIGTVSSNLVELSGSVGTISGYAKSVDDALDGRITEVSGSIESLSTGVVKTSGDQTVAGNKTFSNAIFAGRVEITGTGTASASTADDSVPLVIGTKTGQHISMDGSRLLSKANASTVGQLSINESGGLVSIGMNGEDNGSTGLKTKALWLGNVTSGLLLADADGKVYRQTASAGLVYDNMGTISYKGIGSGEYQVAAGNHTHSQYAPASDISTLSGYITSLQQQINALSGTYLSRFYTDD